jgi:Na+(H+)/acetate symporter ActP
VTGETEVVVLTLPRLLGGQAGSFLGGLVAAGAFSAFLSTSSGLLVSVAGALSHDLAGPIVRRAPDSKRLNLFRLAAVLGGGVAVGLGMLVRPFEINVLVGWAFAIAASAFSPLLILGIWWPYLTKRGAAWGMAVGGTLATGAILVTMVAPQAGWAGALLAQPAIVTVPVAFLTMVLASRGGRPPRDAGEILLLMHSPDRAPTSFVPTARPPFDTADLDG